MQPRLETGSQLEVVVMWVTVVSLDVQDLLDPLVYLEFQVSLILICQQE